MRIDCRRLRRAPRLMRALRRLRLTAMAWDVLDFEHADRRR